MANTAKLGIEVEISQVKDATEALVEFTKAADRARDAFERLGRGFTVGRVVVDTGPELIMPLQKSDVA